MYVRYQPAILPINMNLIKASDKYYQNDVQELDKADWTMNINEEYNLRIIDSKKKTRGKAKAQIWNQREYKL